MISTRHMSTQHVLPVRGLSAAGVWQPPGLLRPVRKDTWGVTGAPHATTHSVQRASWGPQAGPAGGLVVDIIVSIGSYVGHLAPDTRLRIY